jgi:hypothetical protein
VGDVAKRVSNEGRATSEGSGRPGGPCSRSTSRPRNTFRALWHLSGVPSSEAAYARELEVTARALHVYGGRPAAAVPAPFSLVLVTDDVWAEGVADALERASRKFVALVRATGHAPPQGLTLILEPGPR